MTAPLKRERQVELLCEADKRMKARVAEWMSHAQVHDAVCKPSPQKAPAKAFEEITRKIKKCG